MANNFTLKIFTPAGLQFEGRVKAVKLVASQGEIGILPGHVRYTGLLGTGILEYEGESAVANGRAVVSGGFCNFSEETLTVLADTVDLPETVDRTELTKQRPELEKILATESLDNPQWATAKAGLERIEAVERLVVH